MRNYLIRTPHASRFSLSSTWKGAVIAPLCTLVTAAFAGPSCTGLQVEGLAPAQAAETTVKMDFYHKPLPDIPLPNDIATRYDESSATGRRINASMVSPTAFESGVRRRIDQLDGWGVYQPIAIPFQGKPLDVQSILSGHRDADYNFDNDVVYLVNVDQKSANYGEKRALDLGNGNYPVVLQRRDNYWKNDPRVDTLSILYEEADEDKNGNGVLDPGEDTDADGVLDVPNYLPGADPDPTDLAARADALMTFYERETNTLIVRPMTPLEERTTYAVVVTRRLKDEAGNPVGSPYPYINHTAQTEALRPLISVLPKGLTLDDVAFTYTFTTQTVQSDMVAVRDGLYGIGPQAHLGKDFPAEVGSIEQMRDAESYPGAVNLNVMYGEDWLKALPTVLENLLGQDPDSEGYKVALKSYEYVDYFVVGSFQSPQLFARRDDEGNLLPYDDQSWPGNLHSTAAPTFPETVYFTLAVPRKEVSVRKEGKPAPTVIVGHGYGSSRFDGMQFAGFLATHGLATLSIDCPSHGINVDNATATLAKGVLGGFGIGAGAEAVFKDRAFDQNNDGNKDSGADYWSAYLFHTRDMVRQSALDYMQLIRVFSAFDGKTKWKYDVNGDGQNEIAGDFDADGNIDAGGSAEWHMMGGSLGGIMSMYMAGVEPKLTAVAPVSGGGGLGDIGIRSKQGGVPEAFILRGMGPLFAGTIDSATGKTRLEQIAPDLNDARILPIADVEGVKESDTMIVTNLRSGERGCGYVLPGGTVRASVACDVNDPVEISFYQGEQIQGTECELKESAPGATATVKTWEIGGVFQNVDIEKGTPLSAVTEGLGLRRANPEFRRFQGIGQLIIDLGDPANFARYALLQPLKFGNGEETGTHSLVITTMGDMNVPVSSGITYARAAGLIDFMRTDARYGKPVNQELLDDYTAEAAYNIGRYFDPSGNPVHLDIENFSQGTDLWGASIPRKENPYRLGMDKTDALGGKSAAIFPYTVPEGQHGFDQPGEMTDRFRKQCKATCATPGEGDPCGCDNQKTFDIGLFMFHMVGRYFASGGTFLSADLCQSANDCTGKPFAWSAPPPQRDVSTLP
ncbi:MAG: hypothetical protein IPK82_18765 [Polyangiaceae bacterium]|nr:hypothetical protein [Polyangiaceae bacterium]